MDWQTLYLLELLGWTALLAGLLFFPASRLITALSVRRLERKTQRPLDEAEIAGQTRRARFIAFLVALIFSFLFNLNMLEIPGRG